MQKNGVRLAAGHQHLQGACKLCTVGPVRQAAALACGASQPPTPAEWLKIVREKLFNTTLLIRLLRACAAPFGAVFWALESAAASAEDERDRKGGS